MACLIWTSASCHGVLLDLNQNQIVGLIHAQLLPIRLHDSMYNRFFANVVLVLKYQQKQGLGRPKADNEVANPGFLPEGRSP